MVHTHGEARESWQYLLLLVHFPDDIECAIPQPGPATGHGTKEQADPKAAIGHAHCRRELILYQTREKRTNRDREKMDRSFAEFFRC